MSQFNIRKALATKVNSLDLGLPLNFPNMTSSLVIPYGDVYIFFAQPEVATLGQDGEDAQAGYLQINLNMPIDEGDSATFILSNILSEEFKAGSRCYYGDQQVTISNCGLGSGITRDGKYITPITINWYARTRR